MEILTDSEEIRVLRCPFRCRRLCSLMCSFPFRLRSVRPRKEEKLLRGPFMVVHVVILRPLIPTTATCKVLFERGK